MTCASLFIKQGWKWLQALELSTNLPGLPALLIPSYTTGKCGCLFMFHAESNYTSHLPSN